MQSRDENPIVDALERIDLWLDQRGRGAWIFVIVMGFILFWPLGLALLFWRIFGRPKAERRARREEYRDERFSVGIPARPAPASTAPFPPEAPEDFDRFVETLSRGRESDDFDDFLDARASRLRAKTDTDKPAA